MGQEMNINSDAKAKDATGSPHNLNELKNRDYRKGFADRKDVNALISGRGIGKKRAGPNK